MAETEAKKPLPARIIAWALQRKPVRAILLYLEHRGPLLADSITYRTLFSVFAGVLLGFSIAALWLAGNPVAWQALIDAVNAAIPGLVGDEGLIDTSAIEAPAGVTVAGVFSLVALVGAAIGAVGSLRIALRTLADQLTDDVLLVWVLLRNLVLAIGIGASLAAAAAATFIGTALLDVVAEWFGVGPGHPLASWGSWLISLGVVFVLDTLVIAVMFVVLSGVRAPARALWPGALLGGAGLVALQQLSGLFVGGAGNNPLLASFAALIALLIWLNLSTQVILIAASYILTGVEEHDDRVRARHGASTFAQRRVKRAERAVRAAADELTQARQDETKEREDALSPSKGTQT